MLLFRSITLPSSFLCRIPLNRYISHRISPKFSSLQKIKKSKREAKYLSMEDSSFDGEITADGKLSDNSFNVNDDRPVLIMVGSIPVPVKRGMMANNTYEQSPSLASSSKGPKHYLYKVKGINNQPEFRSTPDTTNEKKFTAPAAVRNFGSGHSLVSKRRTRIDLETEQNVVDTNSGTSFSFDLDISSSYDLENLPKNLASQQEELLLDTHLGKKSYPGFVERPKSNHRDSNSVALQKSDCSVSLPKFEPFDICLSGSRSTFMESTHKRELRPGMVLLKHYITHEEQVGIVRTCRDLGLAPGGFYQPGYKDGAKIRLQMMCLGLDWDPQTRKYANKRTIDGSEPPGIPSDFTLLVKKVIQEAHSLLKKEIRVRNVEDILPSMSPDICIVNFYTTSGRLGLHQDRDESRGSLSEGLPVVSFSVGDAAEFLYGDQRDVENAEKVVLESGDVLIFGGKSRHIFHGVASIIPHSAPKALIEDTRLRPGRLNLTFRQY